VDQFHTTKINMKRAYKALFIIICKTIDMRFLQCKTSYSNLYIKTHFIFIDKTHLTLFIIINNL
jgi:hypothetical protein